jgi:hypothetical protein
VPADVVNLPTMLTHDKVVAVAPRSDTAALLELARRCMPPKAVVPLIALVTAMIGEVVRLNLSSADQSHTIKGLTGH